MNLFKKYKDLKLFNKIISHNNKIFPKEKYDTNKIILLEFNNFCINHIIYSYFANILKKKYKANIIAYDGQILLTHDININLLKKINIYLGKFFKLKFFGVYLSFGVKDFYFVDKKKLNKNILQKNVSIFFKKVKNLKDLENYKIYDILIGDLLYDTFLKSNYDLKPTIDLKEAKFRLFVENFIALFLIWYDYFKKNKVKAVISSHAVYSLGIPVRIGTKFNSDNFVVNAESVFRIKKNFLFQFFEVSFFKKIFRKLNPSKKKYLLNKGKQKLSDRINGKYTSDYPYITKSPFGKIRNIKKINKKDRNIFLIATHDFVDAPHAMGNSLFPDFYQWFTHLCEFSNTTKDFWFVKTHPNFGGEYKRYIEYERQIVESISREFPKINILPQNISHQDIVKLGVDAVFTVNGTIGVDYPSLGVPVINASKFNPHINYKFNLHPKSVKELNEMILNFKKFKKKLKINKKEIVEYYAIRNVFFSKDWFFKDLDKLINEVGDYHKIFRPEFYNYWVDNYEIYKEELNLNRKNIGKFISNKDIFLLNHKLGRF